MSRVLVIDDEKEWLELTCERLKRDGFDTLGVCDCIKAFEYINAGGIDLVVLDVKMPLNGRSILWYLRRSRPDIPVVVHSAFGGFRRDPDFEDADDFVVKSPNLSNLAAAVARLLVDGGNGIKAEESNSLESHESGRSWRPTDN